MLPNDPVILLSFVNTELRDNFKSFAEFCKCHCCEGCDIEGRLNAIGYFYDAELNRFV